MNDPGWRVRVIQEMYEGIDNFQSLYKRAKSLFPDGPSSPSGEPCSTARQGPRHQPAVERKAPSYLARVDTHATERDNSSDVPSRRGGSTNVSRGSVDCRAHSSKDVEEEETRSQTGLRSLSDSVYQLNCVKHELRNNLEYDRGRRLDLQGLVKQLSSDRDRDRSQFAFAQLENDRAQRSLRDELSEARQDISSFRGEISERQARDDSQQREHKNLFEMFESKGILHRKKPQTGDTA